MFKISIFQIQFLSFRFTRFFGKFCQNFFVYIAQNIVCLLAKFYPIYTKKLAIFDNKIFLLFTFFKC
uniref:Uncharacterized protein n=1 Tax=Siphoviridae sp. ctnpt50 TaxID=2827941 RepID=A0A8S5SED2_9CAUD|nr:MAG TPA: hypothetical protein [Siphoviridae sp. ctnpt50]